MADATADARMQDDGDNDVRMHGASSSASAAAAASSSAAAAAASSSAASSVPADWRPAIQVDYRSSAISATEPLTARRFDSLTHDQYLAAYSAQSGVHSAGIPIVIDNGAYELRAGFSTDPLPRLAFRSLVGRPRNRKEADYVLVGNELQEGDQYVPQRMRVRSAFESSVVTHWDLMEYTLDYCFMHLGLQGSIPHPLMISEALGNPNYCRAKMSELAFECYSLPGIGYFVQEAAVPHWNRMEDRRTADGDVTGDALVVNVGFEATTVLPIIDERPAFDLAARLNLGGNQLTNHLTHSLLHITQTTHQSQINSHRIGQIVEQYCEVVPESYDQTLEHMARLWDVNQSAPPAAVPARSGIPAPVVFQLPFTAAVVVPVNASDLAAKQEKKEIQRQRLRSLMADRKAQKLADDQDTLADWVALRSELAAKSITPSEFLRQLKRRTFADEKDFLEHFERMKKSIEARLAGENEGDAAAAAAEAQAAEKARKSDSELYPLLFRPDAELTAEEIKEKQKQKRLKGAAEVQAARKREKDARLLAEKQAKDAEAAEFAADPAAFMAALHKQRDTLVQAREDRIKAESETGGGVGGGRRTAAAKKRASLLAAMGGSGGSIESIEKLSRKDRSAFAKEASFGMKEEDWNVYDDLRMPGDAPTRTESDDERENISKIESKMLSYDPSALSSSSAAAGGASGADQRAPQPSDFQFSLWVDRVRLPEMLWQPTALLGMQEAGVGEMVQRALENMEPQVASRVVRNVLLCGGTSLFPHFLTRLTNELRALRPEGSPLRVRMARDPQWDAWKGAAALCNTAPFQSLFLSRAEWSEKGAEYLKEHALSNAFLPAAPEETPEMAKRRKRL